MNTRMNTRTVYGISGDESVVFLDLIAAEKYLFDNYPEYITCKDDLVEFRERMIWEEMVK